MNNQSHSQRDLNREGYLAMLDITSRMWIARATGLELGHGDVIETNMVEGIPVA